MFIHCRPLRSWSSGERVKTNRRNSVTLVKLLRARELRAIWVPDTLHEAVRNLTRAREVAMMISRKSVDSGCQFPLRHGRI
jgi:transposase